MRNAAARALSVFAQALRFHAQAAASAGLGMAAALAAGAAAAQTCAPYAHTLTNGTTADASQVMNNFIAIRNCANNLASGGTLNDATFTGTTAFPGSIAVTSTGSVGIGTTSPAYPLSVQTSGPIPLNLRSTGGGAWARLQPNAGDVWQFGANATGFHVYNETDGATRVLVDTAGLVGVSALASAAGNSLCYNTSALAGYFTLSTCSSLRAYKADIAPLELGLSTLLAMRPVQYTWKTSGEADLGFIAEDVAAVSPLLATYKAGALDGVKYEHLTALLAKSVQEFADVVDVRAALGAGPTLLSRHRASAPALVVDEGGRVGVGQTWPAHALDVNGAVAGTSSYRTVADARLQAQSAPLENPLDAIGKLRGVRFVWLPSDERPLGERLALPVGASHVGLTAQSVQAALPEAVSAAPDGTLSVQEGAIVPLLVEGVKELRSDLAARNAALAHEVQALRAELEAEKYANRAALADMQAHIARLAAGQEPRRASRQRAAGAPCATDCWDAKPQ